MFKQVRLCFASCICTGSSTSAAEEDQNEHDRVLPVSIQANPITQSTLNTTPKTMASSQAQRALVLSSTDEPLSVKSVPVLAATPGSAVVQVCFANVLSYAGNLYSGKLGYPLVTPSITGSSCIGRITDIGSDATKLKVGQLVLFESFVRGRDDAAEVFLSGTHAGATPGGRKLAEGDWKESSYAEYMKVPLENCHLLDEVVFCDKDKGLGYSLEDLSYLFRLVVPMGGLTEMDIKAGDTIVIAPATGSFGGAAVECAVALGATVIACGRNAKSLSKLTNIGGGGFVKTVQLSGDPEKDAGAMGTAAGGQLDAFLDFSPAEASGATHILAALLALKNGGKACLMGGVQDSISIPYGLMMFKSLKLMGRFMYERSATERLVKLVEKGRLVLGEKAGQRTAGTFGLDEWEAAFDAAAKNSGWGVQVLIDPRKAKA